MYMCYTISRSYILQQGHSISDLNILNLNRNSLNFTNKLFISSGADKTPTEMGLLVLVWSFYPYNILNFSCNIWKMLSINRTKK